MIEGFFRKLGTKVPGPLLKAAFNLWPPYLGSGIKVLHIDPDHRYIRACLKRTFYNRNYVGTQFGGSIYSLTDPFYVILFINNLGPDYNVWDKGAEIEYKRPARTRLTAEFRITEDDIARVKAKTEDGEKYIFDMPVNVVDSEGEIVATVQKKLYVRKKKPKHNE